MPNTLEQTSDEIKKLLKSMSLNELYNYIVLDENRFLIGSGSFNILLEMEIMHKQRANDMREAISLILKHKEEFCKMTGMPIEHLDFNESSIILDKDIEEYERLNLKFKDMNLGKTFMSSETYDWVRKKFHIGEYDWEATNKEYVIIVDKHKEEEK
jgi:hypothetical protein